MTSSLNVPINLLTAINSGNDTTSTDINNLTQRTSALNTSITNNMPLYTDALEQNTLTKDILNNEISRLNNQNTILQNAQTGQQRILNLNDSYRKRYTQYLKMIIAITIVLVIVWVFQVLDSRFEGIVPSYLFDLLTVIIVSIGVIYCYLVYSDIGRYNPLNYGELNIAPPPNAVTRAGGDAAPNSNSSISGGGDLLGCSEQSCCKDGTTWNPTIGGCVQGATTTQGFTTLNKSNSSYAEPMTPFEYSDYAPLA